MVRGTGLDPAIRDMAAQGASGLLAPMVQVADMVEKPLKGILAHWRR
jgi:hypothetical protein